MPTFHLALRPIAGAMLRPRLTPPCLLTTPTCLAVSVGADQDPLLTVQVNPDESTLVAAARPGVWHAWRLADGTVQPLPADPQPLTCQAGDAYLAVTPAAALLASGQPGGSGVALARFLHLRDYFNADKLAAAVLAHLAELGSGALAPGAAVLVIEWR